jgi:hypothetical protein
MSDYKTRARMTYSLEVEREGDTSDHACNYKMRVGMTYALEMEREGDVSDHSCDYKTRAETTYLLEVERVTCHIAAESKKRGQG